MHRVRVAVTPPYDVLVGPGALDGAASLLAGRRRAVVVSQAAVADAHGDRLLQALRTGGVDADLVLMGEGEDAKTLVTVEQLCRAMAAGGLLRDDAVVALGGGVVGDTAGFAAAVYQRGVAVVQVPTTLLAQVDAAIGGKTAVNLPEGKNLVGAFHQPLGVLADTATLATLPPRDFGAGLGEVAKYALMPEGGPVAEALGRDRRPGPGPGDLEELVAACATIKAAVVAADPEERTGRRATLNLGHTLAHALETAGGYDLLHGEAVAIGLAFAVHLARALERVDRAEVDRHLALLGSLGLPTRVPGAARADDVLALMRRDKKAHGGLTFVLPGPAGLETVDDPPAAALDAALRAVGIDVGPSATADPADRPSPAHRGA